MQKLYADWTYGGFLASLMLLALVPLLAHGWGPAFTALFLLLPVYMLHQYEEHADDRFRLYVNRTIGGGAEVLTPAAVFVINIGAVWALDVVVFYLARGVALGFGLIAVYLMLVNAVVHIAGAIRSRSYNPGLVTGVVLFLPFGGYAWARIVATGAATPGAHVLGLAIGVGVHAAIVIHALRRRAALARAAG